MRMPDISDLIGVRFKNHGRSKEEGFDCYGYIIEVARRGGKDLRDLWYDRSDGDTFAANADKIIMSMSGTFEETDEQDEGNLIVFLDGGRMVHIGMIVEQDVFTHCDRYGVHIQKLSEYHRRDWRIYRWAE